MSKKAVFNILVVMMVLMGAGQLSYGGPPPVFNGDPKPQVVTNKDDNTITPDESEVDQSGQSGMPEIFYPDTLHDFGTVSQDARVSHKFIVKNVGDAPLKLINAKGS